MENRSMNVTHRNQAVQTNDDTQRTVLTKEHCERNLLLTQTEQCIHRQQQQNTENRSEQDR